MKRTILIQKYSHNRLINVSQDLLRDALDLYENALERLVNAKETVGGHIPGMVDYHLCGEIIERYYQQNPEFDYRGIREGFTPEQLKTLENFQGDKEIRKRTQRNNEIRRYNSW